MGKSKMMSGSPILVGDNTIPGLKIHKEVAAVLPQIEAACRKMGLDYYPIIVEFVPYDAMAELASYGGFPVRYPHWKWGMEYEELALGYEHNQYRISELVVNCCVFGTRVLTDRGSKSIGEVVVGDVVFSRTGPRRVAYTKKQDVSRVVKINLAEFGTDTVCTPNHKWLALRGACPTWVEAKDLVSGDLIISGGKFGNFIGHAPSIVWSKDKAVSETFPSVRTRLKEISPPHVMTLELAELLGVCVGDGSCGVRGAENAIAVTVGKNNGPYRLHVESLISKVFGIAAKVYEKPSAFAVQLNSKLAVDYFDYIGLIKTVTFESKRIPAIIWASSNEYRAAFVRGMFDTDGYVGKYLSYSSRSESLVKDLQLILLEMGIRSKVKHVQNKHNDIWTLIIKQRYNQIEFQNRIGFATDYKSQRLTALVAGTYSMTHGFNIPAVQDAVVALVDALPNQRKLPKWIKTFRWKAKTTNFKSNSIWSFVNRVVAAGYEQFLDILEILCTPLYEVVSVEEVGDEETYDISLDHGDHDFLANGLVSHNTNPCYICCMDSNTLVDNVDVITHAIGHNDFFKNNIFFEPTNDNMMNKLANHGTRIRNYMARWGHEAITEFIDHVLRIETLIDPSKAWRKKKIKNTIVKDERNYEFPERMRYTNIYMDEWINRKDYIEKQNEEIRKREAADFLDIFKGPDRDIFGYIKDHAPLKPWQQDIISMLYEEAMYFQPQRTTQVANEGLASFVDYYLMCEEGLASLGQPSEDAGIWHYADHKWRVLGGKYSQNPYKLGFELFMDIRDRWNKGKFGSEWENCTDLREKERWDKKLGLGMEKVFEVRKHYNDFTMISEFFTEEFCEKKQFFEWRRFPNGEYKIIDRDFKSIKKKLMRKYLNGGLPDIRLVDPNHLGKGWFFMQHYWDDRPLHDSYARETITSLFRLWKNVIVLATKNRDGVEYLYVCNGPSSDKDVHVMKRDTYEQEFLK